MALETQNSASPENGLSLPRREQPFTLQTLQDDAGALLAEFEDKLQKTVHLFKQKAAKQIASEFPRMAEELLARCSAEFEKRSEETAERLRQKLGVAETETAERMQKQVAALGEDAANALMAEAKAAAEKALGEMTGALKEEARAASLGADAALRAVRTTEEQAAERLKAVGDQLGSSLRADHERYFAALSASALKQLEDKAGSGIEAFQEQLDGALAASRRRATAEIEEDISKMAAVLLDRSTGELQRQTEETRERMLTELQNSGASFLAGARQQFENLQKTSIELLNQGAGTAAENAVREAVGNMQRQIDGTISSNSETAVSRLDAEWHQLETQVEASMADHRKQLFEVSIEGIESVQRQLDAHLDAFRGQLEANVQALRQEALERATLDFPRVVAQLTETTVADLEKKAGEAAEAVQREIRTSSVGFAQEVERRVIGDAENALRSLSEATLDQAKNQIRQLFKDVAISHRKEFDGEIEEHLRKQRKSAQAQIEELSRGCLERLREAGAQVVPMPVRSSPGSKLLLIIVALVPTILFLYLMTKPVMRLKADPPVEFLNAFPEWTGRHPEVATRLGEAYWEWAALHLARNYPYGTQLPEQPPVLFRVDGEGFPSGVDADVARLRYWQKLRELWTEPQSWDRVEIWNLK
ncbi:MAG: hypothetical protein ACRD2B_14385 [Terriglobia bacterium]